MTELSTIKNTGSTLTLVISTAVWLGQPRIIACVAKLELVSVNLDQQIEIKTTKYFRDEG